MLYMSVESECTLFILLGGPQLKLLQKVGLNQAELYGGWSRQTQPPHPDASQTGNPMDSHQKLPVVDKLTQEESKHQKRGFKACPDF